MTGETLWYFSRATGVVTLVLLTIVSILGMITAGRRRPRGEQATIVMAMHRWLSLGLLAFLVAHIVTAIADGYVSLGWLSVVLPYTSDYEPLWVGLGTVAVDLMVAVLVTSLLRPRINPRTWRIVHWTSYLMWPSAVVHALVLSTSNQPLLQWISIACAVAFGCAVAWRLMAGHDDRDRRAAIAAQEWS